MLNTLKLKNYAHGGFPVAFANSHGNADFTIHSHDFMELVIIFKGKGTHCIFDREYPIEEGDVFVIPPNVEHGYKNACTLSLFNIMFNLSSFPFIKQYDLQTLPGFHLLFEAEPNLRKSHSFKSRLRLSKKTLKYAENHAIKIQRELEDQTKGFKLATLASFIDLLVFLSRCSPTTTSPEYQTVYRISEVISYLENNYSDDISLDYLGKIAFLSKRHLLRIFKNATGMTPIGYLLKLRINKACILLKNTQLTASQISNEVGFIDSNYFSRQFKKIMNISPIHYRYKK